MISPCTGVPGGVRAVRRIIKTITAASTLRAQSGRGHNTSDRAYLANGEKPVCRELREMSSHECSRISESTHKLP